MGSSDKTGNRGVPASPRDGAPIELVALLYTALRFMQDMHQKGVIKTSTVSLVNGELWSYEHWANVIKSNFECYFWIPSDPSSDNKHVLDQKLIKRRGIYKDLLKADYSHHTEY